MTNKKTIEGIRYIARNTQKMRTWERTVYALGGNSAVMELLEETYNYEDKYMKEYNIYESACIKYGKIDVETLRKQATEISKNNNTDEDETFINMLDEMVSKIDVPYSVIMEEIKNTIGYYHEVQLYDGDEWFDDSEIDTIDYDDEEKGTFTLKEDEE